MTQRLLPKSVNKLRIHKCCSALQELTCKQTRYIPRITCRMPICDFTGGWLFIFYNQGIAAEAAIAPGLSG